MPFGCLWETSPGQEGLWQLEYAAEICRHHLVVFNDNKHTPANTWQKRLSTCETPSFCAWCSEEFCSKCERGRSGVNVAAKRQVPYGWQKFGGNRGCGGHVSGVLHPLATPLSVGTCIEKLLWPYIPEYWSLVKPGAGHESEVADTKLQHAPAKSAFLRMLHCVLQLCLLPAVSTTEAPHGRFWEHHDTPRMRLFTVVQSSSHQQLLS